MAVYKFDKNFKGLIEPMLGDVVELDGARLKVVGEGITGDPAGCCNCVLDNPSCHVDIDQELQDRLCRHTACDGAFREDGLYIHFEEVKDGQ